jgi:hypothetical protein
MISLCWKRVNGLSDADYDELNTYASEYQFSDPTYAIDYLQVQKKYGTSLVALCWVNYIFPQIEIDGNESRME